MTLTVDDFIKLRRVSSIAASPDGAWLAVSVERLDRDGAKFVSDLWKVPTDGGDAVQLTRGDTKDLSPCFRNDGALGFLSNRQPNEKEPDEDAEKRMQVWVLPASGGEPQQVTDEPLGVVAFRFAKSADRMALFAPVITGIGTDKQREAAAERAKKGPSARRFAQQPVRHWDHWLHDDPDRANVHVFSYKADGTERTDLTPEATREFAVEAELDLTADGRRLAVTRQTTGEDRVQDTAVLLIDLMTKAGKLLGVAPKTSNESIHFSPNGQTLALVRAVRSPERVMRPTLTLIDLADETERALGEDWDVWPQLAGWTRDGKALILTVEEDGDVGVYRIAVGDDSHARLTSTKSGGGHSGLEILDDGRIAGIRSTLLSPPECFVLDDPDDPEDTTPRVLARLSGIDPADWAAVERSETVSSDGARIQYFVLKPAKAAGRLPALLWIHGGPINMWSDTWHWRWNPLLAVAAGYALVLPNPRGSTGFGQEFIQGIWGNVWGGQCYADLMAVTDAVGERADIDAGRMTAMGGSFGGYMTNWIGTQTDRFRCLITHASIFTMAQFTGVTDHPPWWYLEMGGEDPYADPERYERYAPIRFVKNWKTPTLVIHGERDYRCPLGEGLNLFEALQYHGVPSELLIFPDENHWILKPRNVVAWYSAVLEFLARHMSGTGPGRGVEAQ